ncbi:hypothetical protein BGX34_004657 [Mortierella sp. NVP85]|nr:hypothetical protein BGX34_004657 [Mortierella sp. NVP85]
MSMLIDNVSPDAYLFEFSNEPGKAAEVEAFKAKIMTMKTVQIRQEFHLLLNGFSAQVKDQDELREIMSWSGLQRVSPLTIVSPPKQVQSTRSPIVSSALSMTGATRVHSQLGLKGKGIKVGVIDTGVDFNHPALGGCFGEGCKIAFGYDFVGDAFDGKNTPMPSDTPMDCAGHGSHVAGIIGASDDVVLGVAPNVTLGVYRVLGCKGSSNDDIILAALELAVIDKMDIINLSIGEPGGWPLNPVARAISKLKDIGVMVTVSQGNENFQGLLSTNYIGVGPSVLAVASVINTRVLLSYFTTPLNQHDPILYVKSNLPGLNTTLPIVAPINGTQFGFGCDPYQSDLTGKVVVVLRGSCLFSVKAQNALDKGAAGILFVNNVAGSLVTTIDPVMIPSGSMSLQQGEKLFNTLGAYSTIGAVPLPGWSNEAIATFSVTPRVFSNEAGGSMSVFSSFGLDNELHIKPDIGAPGENIYSTWPLRNGSYMNLSGTSMASPHVAGALALALERFRMITGSNKPLSWPQIQRIYEIFKNTAKPTHVFMNHMPFDVLSGATLLAPEEELDQDPNPPEMAHRSKVIDSVAKQGAGLINIHRALTSLPFGLRLRTRNERAPMIRSTLVSPSSLELNDTEFSSVSRRRVSRTLTIFNYGSRPVRYQLSHLPAESLHEFSIETRAVKIKNQGLFNVTFPSEKDNNDVMFANAPDTVAKVEFASRWVTVPAGGQRRVAFKIQPPQKPPREEHWVYSGYIVIRAVSKPDHRAMSESSEMAGHNEHFDRDPDHSEAIHVPYAGVKGRMKTLPIFLRPTPTELQVNNQTALCQVLSGSVFNSTELMYSFVEKDVPTLTFCIANPTRFLMLDLITSRVGVNMGNSPTNEQQDEKEGVDYQVIGRIGSNEFVHRSLFSRIVSKVTWDGTLDLMQGHDSNNKTPVGSRLLIHQTLDVDPLEGRAQEEVPDTGNSWLQLVKRDEEAFGKSKEGKEQGDPPSRLASSPKIKGPRNHRPLKASFANDTMSAGQFSVPNGLYRLRLRALRILGNMNNPEDYDVWITPNFTVRRVGNPIPVDSPPPPPSQTSTAAAEPTVVP